MKQIQQFAAIIEREEDGFVALCPELDIPSQGNTVEEVGRNLIERIESFLETADPSEVQSRLRSVRLDSAIRPLRLVNQEREK